jgi:hypothetical protein
LNQDRTPNHVEGFLALTGALAMVLVLVAFLFYQLEQYKKQDLLVVSVDFNQAYHDAKFAGLNVDVGQWLEDRVSDECGQTKRCLILNGESVLGGNAAIDINAEFRGHFGIATAANASAYSVDSELANALKQLSESLGR